MVFEFTEKAAIQLKTVESERLYVKLFKDIPVSDLEMLFPNTRVRMLLWDKIKLAVTGGGGTIGGITAALSKIGGTTLNPVSIIGTLGGLAAVLWRQLSKLFYQRTKYMATLARHLYFYNLDNNFGAITYLLDMAESEEFKEAVLAYYFLLDAGEKGMSEKELDKAVEDYIFCTYDIALDFDVADGIDKLNKHGLIRRTDSGNLTVTDLSASLMLLYERWNGTHSL